MKPKLLIIGALPPPVGGVTMHVSRLLENLRSKKRIFDFTDIKKISVLKLLSAILSHKIIHINISNTYIRFVIVVFAVIFNKKVIFTLHRNLGRGGKINYYTDVLTIKLAHQPLLLNHFSYQRAKIFNSSSLHISAFIPPVNEPDLPVEIIDAIANIKKSYKKIWATNAFNASYDKNNEEIYQLSLLVRIFREIEDQAMIISDPSGTYKTLFLKQRVTIPANVMIIPYPHSFFNILKNCEGLLRITTTDGDSLSIKEGLFLNKKVIASNVVERPEGVILTSLTKEDIKDRIVNSDFTPGHQPLINATDELIGVYNKYSAFN